MNNNVLKKGTFLYALSRRRVHTHSNQGKLFWKSSSEIRWILFWWLFSGENNWIFSGGESEYLDSLIECNLFWLWPSTHTHHKNIYFHQSFSPGWKSNRGYPLCLLPHECPKWVNIANESRSKYFDLLCLRYWRLHALETFTCTSRRWLGWSFLPRKPDWIVSCYPWY